LEASQSTVKKDCDAKPPAAMTASAAAAASASAPAVKNPYATQQKPVNPYAKAAAPTNPYAKSRTSPANPYAKKTTTTSAPALDVKPAATATSKSKPVQINALWADKYAPSNSKEILGNADSVTKLFNWLRNWEDQFNNPKKKTKSISGPNGPWKAALLSGPPGIGEYVFIVYYYSPWLRRSLT
jgi:replication factor C subunit 1